jgi:hypothetical protein
MSEPTNTPTETETPSPAPAPEPPLATKIVVNGGKTELELELEQKLTEAEAGRKKAEQEAAWNADERRRLIEATTPAAPKAKKKTVGTGWFENEES